MFFTSCKNYYLQIQYNLIIKLSFKHQHKVERVTLLAHMA
jgi:hypothetical protein